MAPKKKVIAKPVKRLTMSQLLRATPSAMVSRANNQCHVLRQQYDVGSKDGFRRTYVKNKAYYNEMRVRSSCTDGPRNSYVRFYGKPDKDTECWVWCSCPHFTYNLEVVLARHNSSSVRLSNGDLPKVRNKKMIPYLCKHLVVAARLALAQTKNKAKQKLEDEQKRKAAAAKRQRPQKAPKGKIPKGQFTQPPGSSDLVELS